MNNEQKEVIEHVVYQLELSVMNNLESYEHTEYVDGIEVVSEVSRKALRIDNEMVRTRIKE